MEDNFESGASESVESSGATEQSSPETVSSEPAAQTAQAPAQQETPFHEHPRFKELIETKNQQSETLKAYQGQLAELNQQLQKLQQERVQPQQAKQNPLIERLKGIDPEFASTIEELLQTKEQAAQLQQWQKQQQVEQVRNQAVSRFNNLITENKVPDTLRPAYEAMVEQAVMRKGDKANMADLENAFKSAHDFYSKFTEELKRTERASYTQAKKSDATPQTQTGGAPATKAGKQGPQSLAEVKAEIASRLRASKQI